MKRVLFLMSLMLSFSAFAGGLGDPFEVEARRTALELRKTSSDFNVAMEKFSQAWDRKCGDEEEVHCILTECDVEPQQCRPNRVVLFRGEPTRKEFPGISGLVRTHWSQSSYAQGDVFSLLQQFSLDINLLRPMSAGPDNGDKLTLVRGDSSSQWVYSGTDIEYLPGKKDGRGLSLMNIIFTMHAQAAYPFYLSESKKELPLDPLVSLSFSPRQALRFADGPSAVVIVASVPANEFVTSCKEKLPTPGQIFNPIQCEEVSQFGEEAEVDAFLYIAPKYLYRSYQK